MTQSPLSSESHMPHVLLLAGVGGHTPAEAIASISKVTQKISLIYIDAWAPAARVTAMWQEAPRLGELIVVSNLEAAVAAALALHTRQAIQGVVTYSELLLQPQAQISAQLGLPGSSPEAVAVAQSKALQRQVFTEKGVGSPRFAILTAAEQIPAALAHVGLPAVFKPSLGAGSVGVHQVSSEAEVQQSFADFMQQSSVFLQPDPHALLEQPLALEGAPDAVFADYVSVESLLFDGEIVHLTVTDRAALRHGYAEEGLIMPSHLPAEEQATIIDMADRAIKAIGLTHGAVHTEIAWIDGQAYVIEVNARAGGPIPSMFEAAANYDYAAEIAKSSLNIRSEVRPQFDKIAWQRFVPMPEGQWQVASMAAVPDVMRSIPQLVYLAPRCAVGQNVSRQQSLHLGSFMLVAQNQQEAIQLVAATEQAMAVVLTAQTPSATATASP